MPGNPVGGPRSIASQAKVRRTSVGVVLPGLMMLKTALVPDRPAPIASQYVGMVPSIARPLMAVTSPGERPSPTLAAGVPGAALVMSNPGTAGRPSCVRFEGSAPGSRPNPVQPID